MSYTSREGYNAPVAPLTARGPDPRAASLVSDTLAQNLAQVSGQFMNLWAAADQARAVNDAAGRVAALSMDIADMQRGFDADPDPASVPQRFREKAAEFRAAAIEGLDPAVAGLVARSLDTQLIPTAYRQVSSAASQRHIGNLRGQFADTLGTQAQQIAAARDEPQLLQHVQAIKAGIAGNVAAGLYTQADATPLFSRAIAQAVTLRAAADPQGAQALLERYKGEMDAGTVAQLTTSLRAPLERSRAQGAATATMGARGTAGDIYQAILMQESGGRDGQVSVDGARGRMQIMPGTWAQYARPGENIDNPADNEAVGRRIIDDLAARAGGDPARIAVGYFSGPGNIAPPGSPTPWKEDRRDGNGMSVSRYVAQVLNRLTPAGAERSEAQKGALLADVQQRLADEPLHVQLQGQSLVAQMLNNEQAGSEQARAVLGRQLADLSASYGQGNTGATIPEGQIRALLPPDAAQRAIDTLTLERSAGDAYRAVQFASPADEVALRAQLAGDAADPRLAGERQQVLARFDQAVAAKRRALADDPAQVALQSPEVQALIQRDAPMPEIATASLAAQTRMGVPAWRQRILNDGQVQQLAATLRTTGPEKQDMAGTLAALAERFGPELWNRAYGELVQHGKIGWEWQAIAAMTAPAQAEGRALLQRALVFQAEKGGPEAMKKLVPPDVLKGFDGEVDGALQPLREATRYHPGGDGLFATMRQAVNTLALYHAWRGMKAPEAAERAYQDVIGARWDTAGDDGTGWFGRTPTMLVPKGRAGEIETALDRVRSGLQLTDVAALPDPTRPAATPNERRPATLDAARRGFWINNADASGAVLVARTPGGSIVNLTRPGGAPIEVLFNRLPPRDDPAATAEEQPDPAGARGPRLRQDR
jgi:soluble lytic murein transglycosylase-like protein